MCAHLQHLALRLPTGQREVAHLGGAARSTPRDGERDGERRRNARAAASRCRLGLRVRVRVRRWGKRERRGGAWRLCEVWGEGEDVPTCVPKRSAELSDVQCRKLGGVAAKCSSSHSSKGGLRLKQSATTSGLYLRWVWGGWVRGAGVGRGWGGCGAGGGRGCGWGLARASSEYSA